MRNLRQYGVSVMTLTDLVDDFCLAQGNMRQVGILSVTRHARWVWKDMYRFALWYIRKAVLCVDNKTHSVRLPEDCERVITVSVVDCNGKLHPLGFNSDWNTAKIKCIKSTCSCDSCHGEDTLCGAIDSISAVTETVEVNGQPYTKTTLTRYNNAGAVQTQQTIPAWDAVKQEVVFNTLIETICNVETTSHGCIKATRENMDVLRNNCGCGNFMDEWNSAGLSWGNPARNRELVPAPYNYWGEWNYNAADPNILQIFGGCSAQATHFGNSQAQENEWRSGIRQVIIDYQTNGETPETEILVPEYAVQAIQIGMVYAQKQLAPKISEGDKLAAKQAYTAAKREVVKYLNPILMDNIDKLQTNPRLW